MHVGAASWHYKLRPDGERVAMAPVTEAAAGPMHVTLIFNFFDELRRLAGNLKFLKILDNTFLFDVVEDPMERANLKARRKDVYYGQQHWRSVCRLHRRANQHRAGQSGRACCEP
jgi:hypothetical protein